MKRFSMYSNFIKYLYGEETNYANESALLCVIKCLWYKRTYISKKAFSLSGEDAFFHQGEFYVRDQRKIQHCKGVHGYY